MVKNNVMICLRMPLESQKKYPQTTWATRNNDEMKIAILGLSERLEMYIALLLLALSTPSSKEKSNLSPHHKGMAYHNLVVCQADWVMLVQGSSLVIMILLNSENPTPNNQNHK